MFRHALLVGSIAMFCILSFLLYFNLDAQSPNGLSVTVVGAGLCLLPMSAGLLALALLAPLLVHRFGPRTVLTCAMMLIVIASAVIATSAATLALVWRCPMRRRLTSRFRLCRPGSPVRV